MGFPQALASLCKQCSFQSPCFFIQARIKYLPMCRNQIICLNWLIVPLVNLPFFYLTVLLGCSGQISPFTWNPNAVFFPLQDTHSWPYINSICKSETLLSLEQLGMGSTKLITQDSTVQKCWKWSCVYLDLKSNRYHWASWNIYTVVKWWHCFNLVTKYVLWKTCTEIRNPSSEISDMNNMACISYCLLKFQ